jgi:hypothetical protein
MASAIQSGSRSVEQVGSNIPIRKDGELFWQQTVRGVGGAGTHTIGCPFRKVSTLRARALGLANEPFPICRD